MGISGKQFAELERRLKGGARRSAASETARPIVAGPSVLLGIDPSLRGTGYGVVRRIDGRWQAVAFGTVKCPSSWLRSRCLGQIAGTLRAVVKEHRPEACAVEGLFFAQNLQTALIMGEARGAALAVVAEAGLPVCEIAPRKVKLALVGFGGAQKLAVSKMVQRLLQLPAEPDPDAADALAIALAYAQHSSGRSLNAPKPL